MPSDMITFREKHQVAISSAEMTMPFSLDFCSTYKISVILTYFIDDYFYPTFIQTSLVSGAPL